MNDEPAAYCVNCGGPINAGEPVIQWPDGLIHRFKSTCEFERARIGRESAELAAMVGL